MKGREGNEGKGGEGREDFFVANMHPNTLDGFLCWMLLGGSVGYFISSAHS